MLSKLSKLIMGILWQKPMNPYELTKLVDMNVIQDWYPLTAASVYMAIKNLQSKELICGESVLEGKLPPKTIYALTGKGENVLLTELLEGLSSYNPEASDFGIALFHIGILKQDDALEYIKHRLENLEALYAKANKRLEDYTPKIPFNLRMMLTLNAYRLSAEITITRELITEIENTKDWDTSIIKFME